MELHGERIVIKAMEEGDAAALLSLEVRNKDFFQLFTGRRNAAFYTLGSRLDWIRQSMEMSREDKAYEFLIRLKDSGEVIGRIMLTEVARYNLQSCWIGYFLDKEHNGKGYMTEAVKLVVNYAFEHLKLHRIEAGVMPHNIASMKVLLKAGFHKEGIARKNVKINGRWEDHQILAIVNEKDGEG